MRALLVAGLFGSLVGCNAVLGLDERGRAVDYDDVMAEDSSSVDAVSPDTSLPDDLGAANDSTVDDSTVDDGASIDDSRATLDTRPATLDTAPVMPDTGVIAKGVTCTPACSASQKCYIVWNSTTDVYSATCGIDYAVPGMSLGKCTEVGMNNFVCGDGYACGYLYPGSKACFPLCSPTTATCAATPSAPYCNYRVFSDSVSRCGQCNPRGTGAECGGALAKRCMVTNSTSAPTCTSHGMGGQGNDCKSSNDCRPGFVCSCSLSAGATSIGTECLGSASATCKELCTTTCSTPALTCAAIGTTGYSACR